MDVVIRIMVKDRNMTLSPVTVFGGVGFVGRYIVKELAEAGAAVRVAVRHPERGLFLKSMGEVGQISLVRANILDEASVVAAVSGVAAVVNTVGILFERGRQRFDDIHSEGAKTIAVAARASGVERIIHISAIGADGRSPARYARSKAAGEAAMREKFRDTIIIRPSVVFGAEDDFFNRFAFLARVFPVMPLLAGKTKFQPIYVSDLAKAVVAALNNSDLVGDTFEIGGPQVYQFREMMELIFEQVGRKRILLPLPIALVAPLAAVLEWLPKPPITRDQLCFLRCDNVVGTNVKTISDLGIQATPLEVVLPTYLARFKLGGSYDSNAMSG